MGLLLDQMEEGHAGVKSHGVNMGLRLSIAKVNLKSYGSDRTVGASCMALGSTMYIGVQARRNENEPLKASGLFPHLKHTG